MDCCQYNHKLALAYGLVTIPDRRIFDRRLKTMPTKDIKERISTIGYLIAAENLVVDHSKTATDRVI
jgi:hypothetical protein